nr:MAG TPA: hypothetical protein [Caudoviricetes sp.]
MLRITRRFSLIHGTRDRAQSGCLFKNLTH